MRRSLLTIPEAIVVFVQGFALGGSVADPYEAQRVGELWLLRENEPPEFTCTIS